MKNISHNIFFLTVYVQIHVYKIFNHLYLISFCHDYTFH